MTMGASTQTLAVAIATTAAAITSMSTAAVSSSSQTFLGTGSQTSFTLFQTPMQKSAVWVAENGITQSTADYS
jgi:hypothetical protein